MDDAGSSPTQGGGTPPIPTTFGGVAAVARRQVSWLFCWQLLCAGLAAAVVAWAANVTWGTAIRRAADALPDSGSIRGGHLQWTGPAPVVLHHGPFLSLLVDPASQRESGMTADVSLSIERDALGVRSIFGWLTLPYPPELAIELTRLEISGALAGWTGPALLAIASATFVGLFVSWVVLATAYAIVLWAAAGLIGRLPTFRVVWRLAAAALLPGALLMTGAIVLYVSRQLGLVGLLLMIPLHLVVGWIYCFGALTRLSRQSDIPAMDDGRVSTGRKRTARAVNPFTSE